MKAGAGSAVSPAGIPIVRRLHAASALGGVLAVVCILLAPSVAGAASGLGLPPLGPSHLWASKPLAHGSAPLGRSSSHGAPPAGLPSRAPPTAAAPLPSAPPANGGGTYFTSAALPTPTAGNNTCVYYTYSVSSICQNTTNEPAMNYTSNGILAVAYNSMTNQTACRGLSSSNFTQIQVAFVASKNLGSTWSVPQYLSGRNCPTAHTYPSAWEPSLTSLANGTLVLVYVQLNFTSTLSTGQCSPGPYSYAYNRFPPYYGCANSSRLVVQESYDNGTSWTKPLALNTSAGLATPPERPWVTAYGQTIYVVWSNFTRPLSFYCGYPIFANGSSEGVHLLVSTDGGKTWGSEINLTTFTNLFDYYCSGHARVAFDPTVVTSAAGTVYIAYATNFSEYPLICNAQGNCTTDYSGGVDIELASSTNNGSSFSYSVAAKAVGLSPTFGNAFMDPSPRLAYNDLDHQLYLAYSSEGVYNQCYKFGCYTNLASNVFFTNSSNNGTTWSAARALVTSAPSYPAVADQVDNPAIAVGPGGLVELTANDIIGTICGKIVYPFGSYLNCGERMQVYWRSTDNGTTFGDRILLSGVMTPNANGWDGEYTSIVAAAGQLWIGWVNDTCPGWNSTTVYVNCNYPGYSPTAASSAIATVSELYTGTGITVDFNETGVHAASAWNVTLLGNVHQATAPKNLSFSGVPPGATLFWQVPWVNVSYGILDIPNGSLAPPQSFAKNATVYENFTEVIQLIVSVFPNFPYYYWTATYTTFFNYNLTPSPGTYFLPRFHPIELNVTPIAGCTPAAYLCWNLTFLNWNGSGSGSVNSTAPHVVLSGTGPANETANFAVQGVCGTSFFGGNGSCQNFSSGVVFHETGLPANVTWSVVMNGNQTTSGAVPVLTIPNARLGLDSFAVATVPDPASGKYWVPTTDPLSPILVPSVPVVNVTYALVALGAASFSAELTASGLPNGTSWSANVSGASHAVSAGGTNLTLTGGTYTFNGSFVYFADGTGSYANSVTVVRAVENSSRTFSLPVPATFQVNSSLLVTVNYAPMFRLHVAASAGGTATPADEWVAAGRSVTLGETPNATEYFVGWTGTGNGSYTGNRTAPAIAVNGPITELATFAPIPPPEFTVEVSASGLPAGTNYSVELAGATFSGSGTFDITGLLNGSYALFVPYVYSAVSDGTRYVPTGATSSLPLAGASLTVNANGTLTVTYATEFELTVSSTPNGTISPSAGSYWEASGAPVALTATPNPGFAFVGWNGSGAAGVSSLTAPTITVTMTGAALEVATFTAKPILPPATFWLNVTESGLPTGLAWNVSAGSQGAHGSGSFLLITGLNGSYTVVVPAVPAGTGVRFVPTPSGTFTKTVTQNSSLQVQFVEQFELTVSASAGGTVVPSGSSWYASGTAVTLTATPNSGYRFAAWNGSGSSAVSGGSATQTLTMNSPVTEVATFQPIPPAPKTSAASLSNVGPAIGLLVVLLAVGLAAGYLIFGRRRPPPPAPMPAWESSAQGPSETGSEEAEGTAEGSGGAPMPSDSEWTETNAEPFGAVPQGDGDPPEWRDPALS